MAKRKDTEDFREMELWEHLAELRTRLMRSVVYVVIGLVAAWLVYPWLFDVFMAPLRPIMKAHPDQWKIIFNHFTDGFVIQLQVALVAGLVIALPLVTLELWGFIAPGLTRNEKKVCHVIFPLSLVFFFMGVACGYAVMGPSVAWFAEFVPKDVQVYQNPLTYLMFMVKMVVAFGICFQLPLVLMALSYVGIVSSRVLREQWRMAVVACFVIGAVATPGGDPFSMFLMAAPLAVLYLASIFLCAFVERMKAHQEKRGAVERLGYSGAD